MRGKRPRHFDKIIVYITRPDSPGVGDELNGNLFGWLQVAIREAMPELLERARSMMGEDAKRATLKVEDVGLVCAGERETQGSGLFNWIEDRRK